MLYINKALGRDETNELHPHDVFQLVAGTSTGGLIALMLGKMGMTVSQCIKQYKELSKIIFGKKHVRARFTRGLAPAVSLQGHRKCGYRSCRCPRHDKSLHMLEEMSCSSPSLPES